jgi:hypothetical protein
MVKKALVGAGVFFICELRRLGWGVSFSHCYYKKFSLFQSRKIIKTYECKPQHIVAKV